MSKEYPCVYYDKQKCTLYGSEPGYVDWCVLGPCSKETPSNADRIRQMSDEELAHIWVEPFCDRRTPAECKGFHGDCPTCVMDWLQQPYKEEA